jgi:flagellum-specific ATP synthase
MAELVRLGAYKHGSDPKVDEAILYQPELEKFLSQQKGERVDLPTGYASLAEILGSDQ